MHLKQQIYQHIQSYLDGEITVAAFEEWFIPATWHVGPSGHPERDAELGPVVSYVTSILADFKDHEISERDFRQHLDASALPSSARAG